MAIPLIFAENLEFLINKFSSILQIESSQLHAFLQLYHSHSYLDHTEGHFLILWQVDPYLVATSMNVMKNQIPIEWEGIGLLTLELCLIGCDLVAEMALCSSQTILSSSDIYMK